MSSPPDLPQPVAQRRPFREVALASGLVMPADLDAAESLARQRQAAEATPPGTDGRRRLDALTAGVLVDQGRLTPFQAREMLAGRTRFRLGQYTVIDEVGRGGMGQVFKAEHALMGRLVAVKVLPRSKATPESEAAFRREMRILGRLDHENLVRAFDAGYDAMVYYLVTELVLGVDLRRHVRKHGPLDEVSAASVFSQVARALAFAHAQQLVHRDVKPGNILVTDDGRAKLLDLGLAGSTLEAEALRLGRVVGTMDYIAPEQIRSSDDVGPPADIYALGCSLYYALSGELPFPGGNRKDKMRRHLTEAPVPLQRIAPHLSVPLCQVVEAMMAKSVADRIGSAEEVVRRLAPWTPQQPVPLPQRGTAAPAAPLPELEPLAESSDTDDPAARAWAFADPPVVDAPRGQRRASGAANDELRSLFHQALGVLASSRTTRTIAGVLGPAVLIGGGFAIALAVVRSLDPRGFESLLGGFTPLVGGWGAFLLMTAVLAATRVGRRRRR